MILQGRIPVDVDFYPPTMMRSDQNSLQGTLRALTPACDRKEHTMTSWTPTELDRIGRADEFQIASYRTDGTLRPYVTIWGVRVGESIYVRSAHGGDNPWYRRAIASGTGSIRAGGVERDVTFGRPEAERQASIDAAYHAKYDRYGARIVGTVVGAGLHELTLELIPS
jgi:hypothetical protein